jgi:DNA polymerase-3 subunit gamma/tau
VSDSPALRIAAAQAERMAQAEATILNDPWVQSLMRDYGATLVPGSLQPLSLEKE